MFTETQAPRSFVRRAVGVLDRLAAPHGIDRYVEQVVPTWSSREVRGRIVAVDRSAAGSVVLTIRPNGNWTGFRPGQYTQLGVEIDGVRHTRCYSMASSAHDDREFQLAVRAQAGGVVSNHLVDHAAVGTVVALTPAAGEFHLPDQRPERVVLVSGGSGITPVLAMLRTLVDEGHAGPIGFLHYSLAADQMAFRAEVDAIAATHPNVTVLRSFTDEPGTGELDGFLDPAHLDAVDPDWTRGELYVCGPAPLMDSARRLAAEAGAADRHHEEAFTLPAFVAEAGAGGGTVRFAATGIEVVDDGRPLLDQAEAAGLAPTSGCRMGICHTCTRSMTCGTVRNVVTGEVTTGVDVDIRVCVNAPVGDVAVDL